MSLDISSLARCIRHRLLSPDEQRMPGHVPVKVTALRNHILVMAVLTRQAPSALSSSAGCLQASGAGAAKRASVGWQDNPEDPSEAPGALVA